MTPVKHRKFEYIIFTTMLFLVFFGLIVLYSASIVSSNRLYGNPIYLFVRQSIFCIA